MAVAALDDSKAPSEAPIEAQGVAASDEAAVIIAAVGALAAPSQHPGRQCPQSHPSSQPLQPPSSSFGVAAGAWACDSDSASAEDAG